MKHLGLKITSIVCLFLLGACSTPRTPRMPTEYLLNTDRGTSDLLDDLRSKLVKNKYQIKTFNTETGFLVTHPRKFWIERAGEKQIARQAVQIRQEGGSVKIRMVYDCDYSTESGGNDFERCIIEDADAEHKIKRIERALLKVIKTSLYKNRS